MPPSRTPPASPAPDGAALPLRGVVLWTLVGLAVVAGVVLYFRYERTITPLLG